RVPFFNHLELELRHPARHFFAATAFREVSLILGCQRFGRTDRPSLYRASQLTDKSVLCKFSLGRKRTIRRESLNRTLTIPGPLQQIPKAPGSKWCDRISRVMLNHTTQRSNGALSLTRRARHVDQEHQLLRRRILDRGFEPTHLA